MEKLRLFANAIALIAFIFSLATIAEGQSSRTWVSGTGNDSNPCTRTAPCLTFAAAFGRTAINGEINCVNPAGYGSVTITKSVTIDCEDTQGATLASSVTGIHINLRAFSSTDPQRFVRLRGLSINGSGANGVTGIRGIHINKENTAPITVHIDQLVIDNFTNEGIFFNAAGGELLVRNTVIQNCGTSGLMIDSDNPTAIVHATVEGSSFEHNDRGIHVETAARVTVSKSNLSNNARDGVAVLTQDSSSSDVNLYHCYITGNGFQGVVAFGNPGLATFRIDGNHIVDNIGVGHGTAAGVRVLANAQGLSRGNNTINGNNINVSGVLGTLPNL